ncbi:hypothetical protein [Alphabaculovirus myunipunctae]|uniref:Ac78 n=1 Tax=Mythimna unipuncta nucleopolyhedrovirus TaxID=447897 RepID=A0A2K9VSD9_9ABAC|nr:hypothetical protein [Mythimna unipuncta nucleopolyhedrovirus]AUV65360.1 hypothetical protein [Mythimna unipuncta nucleopolyhedrovirus]
MPTATHRIGIRKRSIKKIYIATAELQKRYTATMSLDIPYERLNATANVDYIPLKLALNDLPDKDGGGGGGETVPKINTNVPDLLSTTTPPPQKQMYDALVLGMLSIFCILVLLYAIYYFVILRGRQKQSAVRSSYMFY